MRPVLHGDIMAAARVLLRLPGLERQTVMQQMLERACFADIYFKRFGRGHPEWGNGSLMAVALAQGLAPEPFLDDPDYCSCFVLVFEALIQWRSELALLNQPRKPHRLPMSGQAVVA